MSDGAIFLEMSQVDPDVGEPPILLTSTYDCPECGKVHELEQCPECGGRDIQLGFGLAFGGYGSYWTCGYCDWFYKKEDTNVE